MRISGEVSIATTKRSRELRFGVGRADGPRSSTWTLKAQKNDVYLMQRQTGGDSKVSFHGDGGPWRFALTSEHLAKPDHLQVPAGVDPRLAKEWPRPPAIAGVTHAFTIFVPWFEVIERSWVERVGVKWIDAPSRGSAVRFDVFFAAPNVIMRPDTRSHGPFALGELVLDSGERVVVLWSTPRISDEVQEQLDRVLSAEVLKDGQPISGLGMLTFSIEDGRGVHVDVTLPDVVTFGRAAFLGGQADCPRCGAKLGAAEDRGQLLAALIAASVAGVPMRHMSCGQYFRARLLA